MWGRFVVVVEGTWMGSSNCQMEANRIAELMFNSFVNYNIGILDRETNKITKYK